MDLMTTVELAVKCASDFPLSDAKVRVPEALYKELTEEGRTQTQEKGTQHGHVVPVPSGRRNLRNRPLRQFSLL